jgi:hypothetical protein
LSAAVAAAVVDLLERRAEAAAVAAVEPQKFCG